MEFVDAQEGPINSTADLPPLKTGDEPLQDLEYAISCKEEGNRLFRLKDYDNAIQSYSNAIISCPQDDSNKENMAIFVGNRAACYYAMEEYQLTVEDCTLAIQNNEKYIKVIMRRCQAYEMLSKLEEAIADVRTVLQLEPGYPKAKETEARLVRLNEERMSKMKDEALGKLKDLGNTILGNFGMSLDNFKMTQDPASGGWNISMSK